MKRKKCKTTREGLTGHRAEPWNNTFDKCGTCGEMIVK